MIDNKAVKILIYYLVVGFFMVSALALSFFCEKTSSSKKYSPNQEYIFSNEKVSIKKVFKTQNGLYAIGNKKNGKEIFIYSLEKNGKVKLHSSFYMSYLYYKNVFYSELNDALVLHSINESAENSIEMISLSGEKLWTYYVNKPISYISFPQNNSKYIALSVEDDNTSKIIMLDLDSHISTEDIILFPNSYVNSYMEDEYIITSYLKPRNTSGATIMRVSTKFGPVWSHKLEKRIQMRSFLHNNHVYTIQSILNKSNIVSYNISSGEKEFTIPISIPIKNDIAIQLGTPVTNDDENFFLAFQGLHKGVPINSGLLQINKDGRCLLKELDEFGLKTLDLIYYNDRMTLVALKLDENGYTEKIEVLYSNAEL